MLACRTKHCVAKEASFDPHIDALPALPQLKKSYLITKLHRTEAKSRCSSPIPQKFLRCRVNCKHTPTQQNTATQLRHLVACDGTGIPTNQSNQQHQTCYRHGYRQSQLHRKQLRYQIQTDSRRQRPVPPTCCRSAEIRTHWIATTRKMLRCTDFQTHSCRSQSGPKCSASHETMNKHDV